LGESLLVAEDDLVGVIVQLAQGDEAAPLLNRFGSGYLETLRIGEDARVFFLDQDGLFAPGAKIAGGAGVDALATLGVEKLGQSEDDADQIEGAALVVSLLHGRRNLVVRLGDDVVEAYSGWIVAPGA